jgi:AcrR family transcriptional regulator
VRLLVSREDYFGAAMDLLAEEGHGALKITPLCKRIGVTTGSFYNYFGSLDGFIAELLVYWEAEQTRRLIDLASAPADPRAQITMLKELALDQIQHEAEGAIRAWANFNPEVAAAQERVDSERIDAVDAVLAQLIPTKRERDLLAIMGISLLAGYQSVRSPIDRRELGLLFDEYEQTLFRHADAAALKAKGRASRSSLPQRRRPAS